MSHYWQVHRDTLLMMRYPRGEAHMMVWPCVVPSRPWRVEQRRCERGQCREQKQPEHKVARQLAQHDGCRAGWGSQQAVPGAALDLAHDRQCRQQRQREREVHASQRRDEILARAVSRDILVHVLALMRNQPARRSLLTCG
jgi:hypothetical protein